MTPHRETWAIVLAGGEGRRLLGWPGPDGAPGVPKQYRRLGGAESLLERTLARAARFAPSSRIVVVVGEHQRPYWEAELVGIPPGNLIVQPLDRGTGVALLAATTLIHLRNPAARVVSLPSDHGVRDENLFADAIEEGLGSLEADPDRVLLLGIAPGADVEGYGWILPGEPIPGGGRAVRGFEEKPTPTRVAELCAAGALVDTFVLAARTRGVLSLFRQGAPRLLDGFLAGLVDGGDSPAALVRHYDRLPRIDVGRDLFAAAPERLAVIPVADCGWIDLGTPERAGRWLADRPSSVMDLSTGRTS